jgi:hypothetical protein
MKALLLGDTPDQSSVGADLAAAGYEVVRCAPPGGRAFPCVGIRGTCPLDASVDVAVVVHDDATAELHPGEAGVVCALRDGVPLVVTGNGATSAFGELVDAVAVGRGDLAAACDRAIRASLRRRGRAAAAALDRHGDTVRASLSADATDADAVRVHRELRVAFPEVRTIDVSRDDLGDPSYWFG